MEILKPNKFFNFNNKLLIILLIKYFLKFKNKNILYVKFQYHIQVKKLLKIN